MTLEQHPIWDQAALLGRLRGKTDRVAKLINLYLVDMPERMNTLSEQVQASDLVEVIASAHTIKGVSANLGIVRLQHKAEELEIAAKASQTEKTASLLEEVALEYSKSESELRAYLESL
tara:strand:+ start:2433 stop:2789 length:357 start_codon:yes stop_codon:yes gene_type:complete